MSIARTAQSRADLYNRDADIAELWRRVERLERGFSTMADDLDAVDRRARPYGDGTSDRDVRRGWPNRNSR